MEKIIRNSSLDPYIFLKTLQKLNNISFNHLNPDRPHYFIYNYYIKDYNFEENFLDFIRPNHLNLNVRFLFYYYLTMYWTSIFRIIFRWTVASSIFQQFHLYDCILTKFRQQLSKTSKVVNYSTYYLKKYLSRFISFFTEDLSIIFTPITVFESSAKFAARVMRIFLQRGFTISQIMHSLTRSLEKFNLVQGIFIDALGRFTRRQRSSKYRIRSGGRPSSIKQRVAYAFETYISDYGFCGISVWIWRIHYNFYGQ